jgi:hypothetical protein
MIYSINDKRESIQTNLSIEIAINFLKQTINRIVKDKSLEKFNMLELLNSNLEVLKNEIFYPLDLQYCVKHLSSEIKVSDEEIKSFLFSILNQRKLENIRKWLSDKEEENTRCYKADVILHFYKFSEEKENLYTNQLQYLVNDTQSCNLTLDNLLGLIKKNIDNLNRDIRCENIQPDLVNCLLEILKIEIFNSNSTKLFTHNPDELDDKVKDYLFSLLSSEKMKVIKNWIDNKENFHKTTNLGVFISIYTPIY